MVGKSYKYSKILHPFLKYILYFTCTSTVIFYFRGVINVSNCSMFKEEYYNFPQLQLKLEMPNKKHVFEHMNSRPRAKFNVILRREYKLTIARFCTWLAKFVNVDVGRRNKHSCFFFKILLVN